MGLCSKVVKLFLALFLVVTAIVLIRTLTLAPKNVTEQECNPLDSDFIKADNELLKRFQTALQFATVSRSTIDLNTVELLKLQNFIKQSKSITCTFVLISLNNAYMHTYSYSE